MTSKLLDDITYPIPNFNGFTVEVWERINNVIPHSIVANRNSKDISFVPFVYVLRTSAVKACLRRECC